MKSYVTLEQHVCPVCGKAEDTGTLLIDKRLKDRFEMHTPTGYGLCAEHKAIVDSGYVICVEADPGKSRIAGDKARMGEVYHTGNIMQVKRTAWDKLFNVPAPPGGMTYISPDAFAYIKRMCEEAGHG